MTNLALLNLALVEISLIPVWNYIPALVKMNRKPSTIYSVIYYLGLHFNATLAKKEIFVFYGINKDLIDCLGIMEHK
jgi:hypothetical protein